MGGRRPSRRRRNTRQSNTKWCADAAKMVAAGRLGEKDLIGAPDHQYGNELNKWAVVCHDRGLKRLNRLERKGRRLAASRREDSNRRLKAILADIKKEAAAGKYSSVTGKTDVDGLKSSKNANEVWQTIKKGCQIAVKQLEEARKQGATDPHIDVWNGKAANKLHAFLGEANKWTERCGKGINLYNAFVAFRNVDPQKARTDPKTYAAQMGSLLKAVGTAMKGLPAPFNAYGEFLAKCGNLFSNMMYGLHPHLRRRNRPVRKHLKFAQ